MFEFKIISKEELAKMQGLRQRMVYATSAKSDGVLYGLYYDADYNKLMVAVKSE